LKLLKKCGTLSARHVVYASQFSVDLPLALKLLQERSQLLGHLLVVTTFSPAVQIKRIGQDFNPPKPLGSLNADPRGYPDFNLPLT
jgi:hypothetical protein